MTSPSSPSSPGSPGHSHSAATANLSRAREETANLAREAVVALGQVARLASTETMGPVYAASKNFAGSADARLDTLAAQWRQMSYMLQDSSAHFEAAQAQLEQIPRVNAQLKAVLDELEG
eukprot:tig00020806_g14037.t1